MSSDSSRDRLLRWCGFRNKHKPTTVRRLDKCCMAWMHLSRRVEGGCAGLQSNCQRSKAGWTGTGTSPSRHRLPHPLPPPEHLYRRAPVQGRAKAAADSGASLRSWLRARPQRIHVVFCMAGPRRELDKQRTIKSAHHLISPRQRTADEAQRVIRN